MNDEIKNTDEKRAVERWENEGGKSAMTAKKREAQHLEFTIIKTKRKGFIQ